MPTPLRPLAPTYVIRQLPAPRCEPPFDDDWPDPIIRDRPGDGVQGMLALSFAPEVPPAATPASILRLVPASQPTRGPTTGAPRVRVGLRPVRVAEPEADDGLAVVPRQPQRTSRDQLPDPRPWARGFVQALSEVLGGFRPMGQLAPRVVPSVATQLIDSQADCAAEPTRQRPIVRSVRVSEPIPGAVEVSATVRHGERCRALALRLEGLDGRWQCTALAIG